MNVAYVLFTAGVGLVILGGFFFYTILGEVNARLPIDRQMRKRSKFLIATLSLLVLYILLALAMPLASGPLVWIIGDKLDWESRRLAGWNARNCGRVSVDADGGKASRCGITRQKTFPCALRIDKHG